MNRELKKLMDAVWDNLMFSEPEHTNNKVSEDSVREIIDRVADELMIDI